MKIKTKGTEDNQAWKEPIDENSRRFNYPEDDFEALQYGKDVIEFFNSTLTRFEKPRVLISVEKHETKITTL